jgi:hypothetical protein
VKKFIVAFLFFVALTGCSTDESKEADLKATKKADTTVVPFTLDLSQSEFKYNSSTTKTFFYTVAGLGDINYTMANSFYVMVIDIKNNFEKRKAYAKAAVEKFKVRGFSILNVEEKEIKINYDDAYEICFAGTYESKPVKFYLVVVGNYKLDLLFCGTAVTNFDSTLLEFKNIAQTLRIK